MANVVGEELQLGGSGGVLAVRPSECNLYINNLPREVTDDRLLQMFSTFGDIESARVMVDYATKISRGYGFVKFRQADSAKNAIQSMDGFQMGSNTLMVKPANENVTGATPNNNVFFKGLPVIVTGEQLRQECSKYGKVQELRILADFATGVSRGQALVRFEDVQGASNCIELLDNRPYPIPGNVKSLTVKFADSEEEKNDRKVKAKKKLGTQRFLPYQNSPTTNPYPSNPYSSYYGVPPPMPDYSYPPNQYFNFNTHDNHQQQQHSNYANQGPTSPQNQMPYQQQQQQQHQQQPQQPQQHHQQQQQQHMHSQIIGGPGLQSSQGMQNPTVYESGQDPNVYVYHLPPETEDSHIYQRFGKYGAILSIKVARDPSGVCKGYGFIRFTTMEAAIGSIEGENGQRVGTKVLAVSLAKKKGNAY